VAPAAVAPAAVAPAAVPSAEEAERIARRIVDDAHLLDGASWDTDVTAVPGVVSAVACRVGVPCPAPPPPVLTSRVVVFHRIVDGRSTSGLDWSVQIGDHGAVQSLSGSWARLELVAPYPLRSVNDVYRDLVDGRAWYGQPVPLAASSIAVAPGSHVEPVHVTVTGARLGAMVMPAYEANAPAAYLVPTYRFEGTYASGGPWNAELLALPPAMIATPKPVQKRTPRVPGRTDG
jgi:hypothetical protein